LGLNDTSNRNVFTAIAGTWNDDGYFGSSGIIGPLFEPLFSAGGSTSLAIDDGHLLSSVGENDYGQLGLGHTTDKDEFEPVIESIPADSVQDMWDYVRCGQDHTLALKIVESTDVLALYDEPLVWPM
jgi:hypothetical protein